MRWMRVAHFWVVACGVLVAGAIHAESARAPARVHGQADHPLAHATDAQVAAALQAPMDVRAAARAAASEDARAGVDDGRQADDAPRAASQPQRLSTVLDREPSTCSAAQIAGRVALYTACVASNRCRVGDIRSGSRPCRVNRLL